ncbi:ABC-F family ATP-binding cassette domain-containing protein [Paraliomyxa miuraensis]|uniref:ABC-F family ATP-binding cassette domain-containing protein n=1 Tax=Paraliomyxa miuraensis TaxID=376150 RepID=UPI002254AF1D|nr:ABC-F family ATP-binding cassette domain-containing protein [Paraliomyxa miuraensis]MCX4241052.1 ABC-F family ATP-binding cassette domain-containing protein [Paraliomyxa miuraensis]
MSLLVLQGVSLAFGKKDLLRELDLRIGAHDRVGLTGVNGSGKSSLMRLMAGMATPDGGEVRARRGLRIGYLPQDIPPHGGTTVLATVTGSVPGRADIDQELRAAEEEMQRASRETDGADGEEALMAAAERLADAHERQAHFEEHYSEHEAHRILAGLGFSDTDHGRDVGELSGGWRMRAHLGALLFQRPELLLLDEPTNHLDLPSVAWFGDFLRRYPHGFVLICHDREFLNEQIDRVVSLEVEGTRQYRGDYESYRKQRAEEEIVLENQAKNLQREREQAERFITRFRAQANKARAVQSRIKALEKMDEVVTFSRREVMRLRFPPTERTGAVVVEVEGLRKAFGDHVVFPGNDLRVQRGEKIGIIGKNGAGKTTLLKMIAGELAADAGAITLGNKVKVGYYAQHHAETLQPGRTVFEEVAAANPRAGATRVRTLLGSFLFHEEDVDKPIDVLSGGERARVALAKILIDPGNVLLMDEPTNHLDLDSSEALAEALTSFDGSLVFVSHNRSFIRTLATRIWDVADGRVETYPGTLDEYLDRHRDPERAAMEAATSAAPGPTREPARAVAATTPDAAAASSVPVESREQRRARKREEAQRRAEQNRALGPLQQRIKDIEARIEALETRQREHNLALADPALYDDPRRRDALLAEYQRDSTELSELTDAWELAQAELDEARAGLPG